MSQPEDNSCPRHPRAPLSPGNAACRPAYPRRDETRPLTAADMVQRAGQCELLFAPGEGRSYSSTGYAVVAYVIEQVTGMTYGDAMRELIFEPLQMHDTVHGDSRMFIARRASPYIPGPGAVINASLKDMSFLVGGGSLVARARDVLRFGEAFRTRSVFSPEAYTTMTDQLGWGRNDVTQWSGSSNGFASCLDIRRADELTVVFTGNLGNGAMMLMREAIPEILAGGQVDPPQRVPPPVPLSEADIAALVGDYAGRGATVPMDVVNGTLLWADSSVAYATGPDQLYLLSFLSPAAVERDDAGEVLAIQVMLQDGRSMAFPRIDR